MKTVKTSEDKGEEDGKEGSRSDSQPQHGRWVVAVRNYTDLIAWQKAMDLTEAVYELSARFPREEMYGLTAQVRRAAVSVPSNIAEGQGRWTTGEFIQFLGVAHGSLCEMETQVRLAVRLKFVAPTDADPILGLATEVGRIIYGLKNSLS